MDTSTPTTMSFTEKFTNIFVAPGELFEDVRQTPNTLSNWLVPMLIFIVVAVLMSQLVLQNPSLADQLGSEIKKQFDQAIEQGKMSPEQAEQAYEYARPGSTMFRLAQIGGVVIGTPIVLFVLALVYWLLGKWGMNGTAPYPKVVEVLGLTFFISALEIIVSTLLQFGTDSLFATPSLGAFVSDFDLQNKLHLVMSKINIFTFWDLSVLSIGLSKLFQRDLPKVIVLVFALWIVWTAFSILTGIRFG
jgi:hypothetical protein